MTRITKHWESSDFLAVCRIADDAHRAASVDGAHRGEGDQATGAIVVLLDRFASPCDCASLAMTYGCSTDPRSLAYAIRDDADERGQTPSHVLVDMLQLQVI